MTLYKLSSKERRRDRPNKVIIKNQKVTSDEQFCDDDLFHCLFSQENIDLPEKLEETSHDLVSHNNIDESKKVDEIYFIVSLIMKENMELKEESSRFRAQLENYRRHYNHITSNCYIIEKDKCPYLPQAIEFERMMTIHTDDFNN